MIRKKKEKNDKLCIILREDLKICQSQASMHKAKGIVSNKIPVRIDDKTILYVTPERYEKHYKHIKPFCRA